MRLYLVKLGFQLLFCWSFCADLNKRPAAVSEDAALAVIGLAQKQMRMSADLRQELRLICSSLIVAAGYLYFKQS